MKFYFTLLLILPLTLFSQEDDSYNLDYNNSQKATELCTRMKSNSFMSNAEADEALGKILSVVGASKRFVLAPCENINNAIAIIDDGMRYILYDPEFVNSISDTSNYWANMSILAHEVGHHINGHTLGSSISAYENKIEELEADEFSGFVMQKIGATLEQSIDAIATIATEGDDTYSSHPNKERRIKAITKGYNNSKDNQFIKEETLSDWEEYFYRGNEKYDAENYEGALNDYSESIKLQPSATTYYKRALTKEKMGDNSGAIYDLQRAVEIDTNHWESYYVLGRNRYYGEDYYGALSAFESYFKVTKWTADYFDLYSSYFMAKSLYFRDVHDKSLSRINWLITENDLTIELENTDIANIYELRGLNYIELDSFKLAKSDFIKASELDPTPAVFQEYIGDTYLETNEYDKAIEYYNKAISIDPNKTTVYEYRAYAHEKKEDYFNALFDMNEAIKLDPEDANYYFKRGEYKTKINDPKGACSDWLIGREKGSEGALEKLIEICGYQKEDFYTADDYFEIAKNEYDNGNHSKALKLFSKSKEMEYFEPDFLDTFLVLAHQELENYSKALEILNSISRDSDQIDIDWVSVKFTYLNYKGENFAAAIKGAKDFIFLKKINPDALDSELNVEYIEENMDRVRYIYINYIGSLIGSSDYENGIKASNQLLKIGKTITSDYYIGIAYFRLAKIKKAKGDYLGALQDINEYIKIYAESPDGYTMRGEIKLAMSAHKFACEDFEKALKLATEQALDDDIVELTELIKINCN